MDFFFYNIENPKRYPFDGVIFNILEKKNLRNNMAIKVWRFYIWCEMRGLARI